MTGRTGREQELSARVATLPTASQAALLKILVRSATRQMESALALLEDLGMAPASEDGGEADHTAEQDAADWQRPAAEDGHTPVPLRAVPPAPQSPPDRMLQPARASRDTEKDCGDVHGEYPCTAREDHGDLDHAFHDEDGRVVTCWPATPGPGEGWPTVAELLSGTATRATPGAGGPQ